VPAVWRFVLRPSRQSAILVATGMSHRSRETA